MNMSSHMQRGVGRFSLGGSPIYSRRKAARLKGDKASSKQFALLKTKAKTARLHTYTFLRMSSELNMSAKFWARIAYVNCDLSPERGLAQVDCTSNQALYRSFASTEPEYTCPSK